MNDQVKLSCNIIVSASNVVVQSPVLDLYTCSKSLFTKLYYPQDLIIDQNSNGDVSFNLNSYFSASEIKTKCYWDNVQLYSIIG